MGADIYAKSNDGRNLLMKSISREKKDVIDFLLTEGIDINEKDNEESTLLFHACTIKLRYKNHQIPFIKRR